MITKDLLPQLYDSITIKELIKTLVDLDELLDTLVDKALIDLNELHNVLDEILEFLVDVPGSEAEWVQSPRIEATVYVFTLTVVTKPIIFTMPIMNSVGFTAAAMRDGPFVARMQAHVSWVAAHCLAIVLRSAAAGGWGSIVLKWAAFILGCASMARECFKKDAMKKASEGWKVMIMGAHEEIK